MVDSRDQVVVYTPESPLRHPAAFLREMGTDLLASRALAWRLAQRDIQAQYRQSWLGIVWAFVPALAIAIGLTAASDANIVNLGATPMPYPAYVLLNMTLWQVFAGSLRAPLNSLNSSRVLFVKLKVPVEAAVLAGIGKLLFDFAIALVLVAAAFAYFRIAVSWWSITALVPLVHLIALGTAIGLFLAPVGTLYTDVQRLLTFALPAWLFLTPVVYSPPQSGWFAVLVRWNPVTPMLVTLRECLTGGPWSQIGPFLAVSAVAFVALVIAWIFARLSLPIIAERMSS